jgi:hypothetical protein
MPASYVVTLIASLVGQPGKAPDLPPFAREHAKTLTFYYRNPDPALGPKLLGELLKKENLDHPFFAKDDYALRLNAALLGDIGIGNPKVVRAYEAAFSGAAPKGRPIVLRALIACGDRETVKQIDAWLADPRYADSRDELEAVKGNLQDPERKHVRDRPVASPDDLDRLWGNFFITGEYAPVARILDVLDLPDAKENLVLKRVARWSLGSNLIQHPKLVELVRKHVKDRPGASRKVAEEVVRTVEQLPGRWLSQDGQQHPLVFGKDGSFQCGFFQQDGKWVMATGQFQFAQDGKIATRAEYEGSTLFQTYTMLDGVLNGSRGPNPRVEWKKVRE